MTGSVKSVCYVKCEIENERSILLIARKVNREGKVEKFFVFIRLYAHNRVSVSTKGNKQYAAIVKKCMQGATSAWCYFNKEWFIRDMREEGVPDPLITEFLDNLFMDDQVILRPTHFF